MDFNEFWKNYTSKDITTISDLVIETFNQKLPDNIEEEYDLGEIVAEFSGHHETAKKYDKIELFGEVLKNKQPDLYKKEGGYINEALIKYYCFTKDEDKLVTQIEDAITRDYNYDLLLESFKQLLYNQYIVHANGIIESEYDNVTKSLKLIQGAEFDFAIVKYYIELEELFLEKNDNSNIDLTLFKKKLSQYGFNFDDPYLKQLEMGLINNSVDKPLNLLKDLPADRSNLIGTLEMKFLRFMQKKNCPFPIGGMICYNLFQYFEDRNTKNWQNYFKFEIYSFKEFVNSKSSFLYNNTIEIVLLIWGSSYFLDFIYQSQIILESNYLIQKELIETIKNEFKEKNKHDLWEYNFIHEWKPDETTSLENWNIEKSKFEISYELEISQNEFNELKLKKLFGNSFLIQKDNISSSKPLINTNKIGRNEKVNVKYIDGTIQKNVKFKKVEDDIKNGKCEII